MVTPEGLISFFTNIDPIDVLFSSWSTGMGITFAETSMLPFYKQLHRCNAGRA
jgi:hypothetical protein